MWALCPGYVKELRPDAWTKPCWCAARPVMIKFTLAGACRSMGFQKDQVYTTLELRMKCGIGKCGRCNIGGQVCLQGRSGVPLRPAGPSCPTSIDKEVATMEEMVHVYFLWESSIKSQQTLTIMRAMEYAGYQLVRGCGCRNGFCGACATIVPGEGQAGSLRPAWPARPRWRRTCTLPPCPFSRW